MAQTKTHKDHYFSQVYKIRETALYMAVFCTGVFLVLDMIRFEGELYQEVLSARIIYQVAPILIAVVMRLIQKYKEVNRFSLDYFMSIAVVCFGVGHVEIFHISQLNDFYFPKVGLAIVLIYSGVLLALPMSLATMSSALIIIYAVYNSYINGNFAESISDSVLYSLFAFCCVLTNFIYSKILMTNLNMVNQIQVLANTDNLTNLNNRRYFLEKAESALKLSMRENVTLALILIDLDNFKKINDLKGHKKGDRLLIKVGQILKEKCRRPMDLAARFGGDEFVLLLYDSDRKHIESICAQINEEIKHMAEVFKDNYQINNFGASIGAVIAVEDSDCDLERLLDIADRELYKVKESGKNTFSLATTSEYTHCSDDSGVFNAIDFNKNP